MEITGSTSFQGKKKGFISTLSPDGEAKFWVEPIVALVAYTGFSKRQLSRLQRIVEEHKGEIVKAWQKHFEA